MLIEVIAFAEPWIAPFLAAACLTWALWLLLVASAAFRRHEPEALSPPAEDDLAFLRRLHIRF
jgi:hypothetical protein